MLAYKGHRISDFNEIVGTIFHGDIKEAPFDQLMEEILGQIKKFSKIHTASRIMEERLQAWGVPPDILTRIPLGVDLEHFRPTGNEEKAKLRNEMGIPQDAYVIGSFQKDGSGWGEGLEPKAIKGPDVLLKVIERLQKNYPIFVLLSAPARGYVKRGLEALKTPYRHIFEKDYRRIPRMFNAIDVYLLTSREEGGPEGVLESMASGVPFVGTSVGLVPDVVTHGKDGLLAASEDVNGLVEHVARLWEDPELGIQLKKKGLQTIKAYDWPLIADRYHQEIYAPLIARLT
jgi:glycosyltransferase involved in cell wall biosynthesis